MKKRLLSSLLLGLLSAVILLPLLPSKVSAAEDAHWVDSNTINFRDNDYFLRSNGGSESYIRKGDISDLCSKDQKSMSQDTKKYGPKYGEQINTIRDISGDRKKANHITYQIAIFDSSGNEKSADAPFDSSAVSGDYYGCKEVPNSKIPLTLTDSPKSDWKFRWVDAGKIERSDGSRQYTQNDKGEFVWEADGNSTGCKEKIVPRPDNLTGVLYHDGTTSGGGGCAFTSDPHSIASPENQAKPKGTGESHTGSDGAAGGDQKKPSCESNGGKMSWLLCPVLEYAGEFLQKVDEQLNHLLQVPNDFFECPPSKPDCAGVKQLKDTWARIRNIAYIFLVPIMLVMVIGTALGFELVSAYTVKKALPRLVIALIFMTLSFEITKFFIIVTNDIGRGVLGLITSAFSGHKDITLASLFNPGGAAGTSFTVIIIAGGALALGALGIILSYVFVAACVIFAAFLLLALRQMLLIALIVIAPLAILVWIFPGNDKFWKIWRETFTGLLLLYPLVMLLIGAGRAFALLASETGDAGLLRTLLILTAYIGPYFFIPAAFKFAGGAFANISGMVNNKSRGLFDRQKKYRERKYGEKGRDIKAGDYYKHGATGLNRTLAGAAVGPKGNFGFGRKGRQATSMNARVIAAQRLKENPKLAELSISSDEGHAIMALGGTSAAQAQQMRDALLANQLQMRQAENQAAVQNGTMTQAESDANYATYETEARGRFDRGYAAASAVGFSATNARAALGSLGKARAIGGPNGGALLQQGVANLTGSNQDDNEYTLDAVRFQMRQNGRADLGADTMDRGINRVGANQILEGPTVGVMTVANRLTQRFNTAITEGNQAEAIAAATEMAGLRNGLSARTTQESRQVVMQMLQNVGLDITSQASTDEQFGQALVTRLPIARSAQDITNEIRNRAGMYDQGTRGVNPDIIGRNQQEPPNEP